MPNKDKYRGSKGGANPLLLPPSVGVILAGRWSDGVFRATYTGKGWLAEEGDRLVKRNAPIEYFHIGKEQ